MNNLITNHTRQEDNSAKVNLPFEEERWDILHWAKVSFRYHKKREWFFNTCDLTTQLVCTLAGVAVFADFFTKIRAAGALVAVASVLALLVRYNDCKQKHVELGKRIQALIADIEKVPAKEVASAHIAAWAEIRSAISGDEPPSIKTLVALCEKEQCIEDGWPDHAKYLTTFQHLHKHFF